MAKKKIYIKPSIKDLRKHRNDIMRRIDYEDTHPKTKVNPDNEDTKTLLIQQLNAVDEAIASSVKEE